MRPETKRPHAADYFGETRDYWWNHDFLALMAERWRLREAHSILDVGAGAGHWGYTLEPFLLKTARVVGVDRETAWVTEAGKRSAARGLANRYTYRLGDAERLPFHDKSFDMVTCQTVLIHLQNPRKAIAEMFRVVKGGGIVAVVEPNNLMASLALSSAAFYEPVDDIVALVRFQLRCERGKEALGEGNNSIGELVPGFFIDAGFRDVEVYQSDKASPLFPVLPPYANAEQRALIEENRKFLDEDFWIWSRADTHRYFLAGGGLDDDFAPDWARALNANAKLVADATQGKAHGAGGRLSYLVSGRRAH